MPSSGSGVGWTDFSCVAMRRFYLLDRADCRRLATTPMLANRAEHGLRTIPSGALERPIRRNGGKPNDEHLRSSRFLDRGRSGSACRPRRPRRPMRSCAAPRRSPPPRSIATRGCGPASSRGRGATRSRSAATALSRSASARRVRWLRATPGGSTSAGHWWCRA